MRVLFASIVALTIGSAINNAQAASENAGRWCVVSDNNSARHCYFRRHRECMKAILGGGGVCVPNEATRGNMLDDNSK
jgi:hypothetical protein